MKKHVPLAVTLLLLSGLTAACQLPTLEISQTNGNAVLSWTNSSNGTLAPLTKIQILQTAPDLSSATWTNLTVDPEIPGFSLPAKNPQQFFRLYLMIPIFNFAIFYNMNLETAMAQTFYVQGPVFSNAGIWAGSKTTTFASTVSAVGPVINSTSDPFCAGYSGAGLPTYLLSDQPTSGAPPLTGFGVNTYANPAAAESFLNLPPTNYVLGTSAAFTTSGQEYVANEADLYLTNFPSGTNWGWTGPWPQGSPLALYYQDSVNTPNYLMWVTNDYYVISNRNGSSHMLFITNYVSFPTNGPYYASTYLSTNSFWFTNGATMIQWTNNPPGTNQVVYMGYSFLTNVLFYDWREGWRNNGTGPPKTVQAVQLNMQSFNRWLTNTAVNGGSAYNNQCENDKGHPIDSIYIYNAVPLTTTTLPAIRVMHGGQMPFSNGFTLATPMPLYVWGDYNVSNSFGTSISQNNTVYTEPAALMADSITVLSDGWLDTNSIHKYTGGPTASATTVNAACIFRHC
jgi:hypothetical protein